MLHTEAYAILWLLSGARYERIDPIACADAARRNVRERRVGADPAEGEGVVKNPHDTGASADAVSAVAGVVMETIDSAEAKLSTLAQAGEPSTWLTPQECVAADRADAEDRLPIKVGDLWGLVFEAAGAATAGFFRRSGEVFPSEEVSGAVARVLHDHGFREAPVGYQGAVEAMEEAAVRRAVGHGETPVGSKAQDGVGIPDRSKHGRP